MFQISANISHIFGPWLILLQMLDIQDSTNWIRLSLILPCYGSWPSWLHKVSLFLVMRCSIFPLFHRHKPSNSCRVYPSPISSIVRAYIAQSQAQSSMLPLLHLELHEVPQTFYLFMLQRRLTGPAELTGGKLPRSSTLLHCFDKIAPSPN